MEATKLFLPHMQAIYTRSRIYIGLNHHDILIYLYWNRLLLYIYIYIFLFFFNS